MTDQNQAAERLRRWKEDCFTCNMEQVGKDRALLADAWLAEHAVDNGEAITWDYWSSLGLNEDGDLVAGDYFLSWWQYDSHHWLQMSTKDCEINLPHITTRGQLRLLLRALTPESEANRE